MQKVNRILLAFALPLLLASFILPKKEKINWISLEELQVAYKKTPKPILIDVYTNWCGWCKVMDKETYGKQKVADYINQHYYAVKFNAETTDSVRLNNKTYGYNRTYKVNDLAVYLLYGRLGYPATVILSAPDAQPAPLSGFMKPSELEAPLKYFGDGAYAKQDYPEYMRTFNRSW